MADALKLCPGLPIDLPPISVQSQTNLALNASDAALAVAFSPATNDAITHLGFLYGVRTGTPPTYRISLQGLDATGVPDGTVLGGGAPASATFTPPADATWNSTWRWVALDNSFTPTRGVPILSMCIEHSAGTIDGSNNSSFARNYGFNAGSTFGILPYIITKASGGAFIKQTAMIPIYGYRTAANRYGIIATGGGVSTIGTNGHRAVAHLTLPAGWSDTHKLKGAKIGITPPAAGNEFIVGLWDAAGSAIQSATYDSDHLAAIANRIVECYFDEASLTALSFGTKYYLGIERVAASCALTYTDVDEADNRLAWPLESSIGLATWNGSAWAEDNTVYPSVVPLFDDITEPAGGGGGAVFPDVIHGGPVV